MVRSIMSFIPSCREVSELLSRAHEHPLTFGEKVALYAHLAMCEACRNFRRQLEFLRMAVKRYVEHGG